MAEEALEGAFAGPATVAVHDDGDVVGDARGVELRVDLLLFRGELMEATGDAGSGGGSAQSDLFRG